MRTPFCLMFSKVITVRYQRLALRPKSNMVRIVTRGEKVIHTCS